jgi:hypothetical protein
MIFLSESTFLLEGVPAGDTKIQFEPNATGRSQARTVQGPGDHRAGLATKAGEEISDVIIVIGDAR